LKSHVFSAAEELLVAMAGIRLGGGGVNSLVASPGLQKLTVPSPSTTVVAAGCSRFKKLGLKKVSGSRRRPFRILAADVPDFLPTTWYDKSVFNFTQNSELCIFLSFPVSQKLRLEPCNPRQLDECELSEPLRYNASVGLKNMIKSNFAGSSFLSMCATKSSGKSVLAAHLSILLSI
jgi:hypothetical protein